MPLHNLILIRKGSEADWINSGAVLASGEPGFDTTNRILKVGNGSSTWANLLNKAVFSDIDIKNSLIVGSSSSSPFLFANSSGVSIGKNNPAYNLDVVGTGNFTQNLLVSGIPLSEIIDDEVASLLKAGSGISLSYDDSSNQLTISTTGLQSLLNNYVTGTGIINHVAYWDSASNIVADSGQLFWDPSNNRLGIGTATPATSLEISGALKFVNCSTRICRGDNNSISISGISNSLGHYGVYIDNRATTNGRMFRLASWADGTTGKFIIRDDSASTDRLTIDSQGRVGIANTDPSGALDVTGDVFVRNSSNTSANIYLKSQSASSDTSCRIRTDTFGNLFLDANSASVKVGNQGADIVLAAGNAPITIGNSFASTLSNQNIRFTPANTERMRITPSGIGIGTSNPTATLDIFGTVRVSGTTTTTLEMYDNAAASYSSLVMNGNDFTINSKHIVAGFSVGVRGNRGTNVGMESNGPNGHLALAAGGSERARITTAGDFGLGFTAPSGKLSVNGGVSIGANYNLSPPTNGLIVEGRVGISETNPSYKLEVKNGAPFFYPNETGADAAALHLGRYTTGYGQFFSIRTNDETSYRTSFVINRFIGRYRFSIEDATLGTEHQLEIRPETSGNCLDIYDFNNQVRTKISAGTTHSYINGGGNLGINNVSPVTALDVSGVITAVGGNSTNWNSAHSWGNHAAAGYAPLNSPTLTGVPLAPTALSGTNTNQIASTAFVRTEISNLVASAPTALDTLNELATALGNDPNFATTVTNNIANKVSKSGDTMTGTLNAPTGIFSGNVRISSQTINTIASFDSDRNIVSLNTGTYPSLTELTYVKGVTSSIQTQLNGKQATLTNPVTGTGTPGKLPKWTSTSGLTDSIITENASVLEIFGSIRGRTDDTYFSLDASSNRVGITKKGGFFSKFTYGSASEFAIAQSNATDILPTGTFTDRFVIKSDGNVGIGTTNPAYKLQVNGDFGATTKSFRIDHPSKSGWSLEYGSLESPYHGVRLTGRGKIINGHGIVKLPYYLKDLIHDDESITIQLTNYKHSKTLYISSIDLQNDQFIVKADRAKSLGELEFFWSLTGTRKDVENLVVEKEK